MASWRAMGDAEASYSEDFEGGRSGTIRWVSVMTWRMVSPHVARFRVWGHDELPFRNLHLYTVVSRSYSLLRLDFLVNRQDCP